MPYGPLDSFLPIRRIFVSGVEQAFVRDVDFSSGIVGSVVDGVLTIDVDTSSIEFPEADFEQAGIMSLDDYTKLYNIRYTSGVLATDLSSIGSNEVTLRIRGTVTMGNSPVVVPANVTLEILDNGRLSLAAGQTLTINGPLDAPLRQIFAYADETCAVTLSSSGRQTLYPEWWGAKGDNSTDDTTAIKRMFKVPSALGTGNHVVFSSGRTYRVTSTIPLYQSTGHTQWTISGYGAYIKGLLASNECIFQVGDTATSKPCTYVTIEGLRLAKTSGSVVAGTACIRIDYGSFGVVRDVETSGHYYGIEYKNFGGNGWSFINVNCSGHTICFSAGPNLAGVGASSNTWSWRGGKVQQSTGTAGMHVYAAGGFSVTGHTDLSIHPECAILLDTCSEFQLELYTENVGPDTPANSAACIRLVDSQCGSVRGCRINGAGSANNSNAKYGIEISGAKSRDLTLENNFFTRHQVADIFVDSDVPGRTIVIAATNRREDGDDGTFRDYIKVSDASFGRVQNEVRTRDLFAGTVFNPFAGTPRNLIQSPNDFSVGEWELAFATIESETILAPDGVSQAQVINFPNTATAGTTTDLSYLKLTSTATDSGEPLNGKIIVVRYWEKPIDVIEASSTGYDFHRLRCEVARVPSDLERHDTDGCYDGTDDWQFRELRHVVDTETSNTSTINVLKFHPSQSAGDAIQVALWGVQMFVVSDAREHVPPYHPANEQEADPGILVNSTGQTPDLTIEALTTLTDSPASADALRDDLHTNWKPAIERNFSDLADRDATWRLLLRNTGLIKQINPLELAGITAWFEPGRSADDATDLANVSSYRNLKGVGTNPSQTGTNRPTYQESGINGMPAIKCVEASSQYLTTVTTVANYWGATADMIIIVCQPDTISSDSANSYANVGVISDSPASAYRGVVFKSTGPKAVSYAYDGEDVHSDATIPGLDAPLIIASWRSGLSIYTQVNGGTPVVTTTGVGNGTVDAQGGALQIGRMQTHYFDGLIGDIMFFNALSLPVKDLVLEYLADKYSITLG